ncbi:MAG: hypothetical protein PHV33_06040 [Elusimicrobiales bacterium]|nr:hypothetical protein [Elusimicrobiales bacterium]
MRLIKTAVLAAVFTLPAAASELSNISPADVREIYSDIALPAAQPAFVESSLTSQALPPETSRPAEDQKAPLPRPAFAEALAKKDGLDPVVITVSGLKFGEIGWGSLELRNFLRMIQFFTRNKDITDSDIANGIVGFSPRYFFPEHDEDARELVREVRLPDNYLELKLKEIPGYENHNVIVIPFTWSRDPGDSKATIPQLQAKITEVYDAFKGSGRPVYILAHSWGSVLTHTALHRVAAARPDVRIDKLITAGSPLVPANYVVKLFMKLEVRKEKLEKVVRKPAIVGTWRNFWAMRDAYSNAIPAADYNFQADAEVENVEPKLIDFILHYKPLRKEARKDLFKIRDIKAWHGAYFFDFKASLKTLEKEIAVEVFRPALAPQVVDCAKNPQANMCRP